MGEASIGWKQWGFHYGSVRFALLVPDPVEAVKCNCPICRMLGYQHLIVERGRFRLLQGEDKLTIYGFNTGAAKQLFCSVCGVKSFYVPRSHPDGFSVNVRCLDDGAVGIARVTPFDGRNREQSITALRAGEA
jgi:hypothetical protein